RSIGIGPGLQGQGFGSALMRPTLERCDSDGLPAYLEASSERSAALYARLGFIHLGVLELADGAPPLWLMRRPPGGCTLRGGTCHSYGTTHAWTSSPHPVPRD